MRQSSPSGATGKELSCVKADALRYVTRIGVKEKGYRPLQKNMSEGMATKSIHEVAGSIGNAHIGVVVLPCRVDQLEMRGEVAEKRNNDEDELIAWVKQMSMKLIPVVALGSNSEVRRSRIPRR